MDASVETELTAFKQLPFRKRYFAQRVVYPWELPSIMRKHIYTGVMGSLYFALIAGIFFIEYARRIGVTDYQFSLMGGISSFLLSVQLVSAYLTQRIGRRKAMWFWFAVAGRGTRFAGIALALVFFRMGLSHAGVVLIVAVSVANFLGAMAFPPWMSWLADIIPTEHHGGFWGRRSAWIALFMIGVMVPSGVLLDWIPEAYKLDVLLTLFLAAEIVGLLDAIIHGTIPEPAMEKPDPGHFVAHLLEPLRDRGFRPWLLFNGVWTFAMTLGGSLATIYFLRDLGIDRNLLGGAIVLGGIPLTGGVLLGKWSGRMVDRHGPKRVLFWGHLFWSFLPLFWFWATPATAIVLLSCSSLVGGMSTTAAITAANKLITRFPPPGHRAMYVAVSSCVGSLAGAAGVFTAGIVLKVFEGWSLVALGTTLCPYHLLFAGSLALRLGSTVLLVRGIRNPGDAAC